MRPEAHAATLTAMKAVLLRRVPRVLVAGLLVSAAALTSACGGGGGAAPGGPGAGAPPARWVIRDLGTLGGSHSLASDINDRGQVVGTSRMESGARHAFLWEDGQMRDLGELGGDLGSMPLVSERGDVVWTPGPPRSGLLWRDDKTHALGFRASALSDRGEVVGTAGTSAYAWADGRTRQLGTVQWFPAAINDAGEVAGVSFQLDGSSRAFVWRDGRLHDLRALPAFTGSVATGINEQGLVIGFSERRPDPQRPEVWEARPFLWKDGAMHGLGTPESTVIAVPDSINGRGDVVGRAFVRARVHSTSRGLEHAMLWADSRIVDLGPVEPPAGLLSPVVPPVALNERGQIVAGFRRFGAHAAVWQDGRLIDLGALPGASASRAVALNERGEIVGWSTTGNGRADRHAVLWTPVRPGAH